MFSAVRHFSTRLAFDVWDVLVCIGVIGLPVAFALHSLYWVHGHIDGYTYQPYEANATTAWRRVFLPHGLWVAPVESDYCHGALFNAYVALAWYTHSVFTTFGMLVSVPTALSGASCPGVLTGIVILNAAMAGYLVVRRPMITPMLTATLVATHTLKSVMAAGNAMDAAWMVDATVGGVFAVSTVTTVTVAVGFVYEWQHCAEKPEVSLLTEEDRRSNETEMGTMPSKSIAPKITSPDTAVPSKIRPEDIEL